MKKGKKVPMESSPYCPSSSYSVPVGEEEAKARSRHRSLMLDYLELQKEIEAKRRKITEANKKKHKLSTVVKFLRRKFTSLSKKPYQNIQVRVKKHSHKLLPPLNVQSKVPLKDGQEVRETSVPSTTALFDLNQIIPSGDEMNDIQIGMGSPVTDLSNMTFVDGDAEKRTIQWQDQMAVGA
ncbi:uncharacterized protein M6B38_266770 [Iris pallida]|uniref:Uncharacterized protein n=1 Tax=Iris pallida TaxID=29817 RepID=A0AAX6I949_IRIPA|nr:uncharacterized protein M6B38_266770 [Iris pallida]